MKPLPKATSLNTSSVVSRSPQSANNTVKAASLDHALKRMASEIEFNGLTKTSKEVLDHEMKAALFSIDTGLYGVWRSNKKNPSFGCIQDCVRLGPESTCFCGHSLKDHFKSGKRLDVGRCNNCLDCKLFEFVPTKPEEVGEFWLTTRQNCK